MRLSIKGKPKKIDKEFCRKAVKWYGKKLLGPRLYEKVSLCVNFTNEGMVNLMNGYCDAEFFGEAVRDFTIGIKPNLPERETLLVLAHEMVHMKQYAKGQMKYLMRSQSIKWKNKKVNTDRIDYWDFPWEIEAYGMEKGLYCRFIESLTENKK